MAIIRTQGLVKHFGNFTAVGGINLTVNSGEIYGFLGPNGAGKTTTLLMLLNILKPTDGTIEIFGQPLATHAFDIKRRIGVVAEYQSFYDEMTALEYLLFFADIYQVADAKTRAESLLERLDLAEWRDQVIRGFSTGMQRKLGHARALLHQPDLLFLDEPISGLDPYGIIQVRELLLEANRHGTTIFISSHILSEIENTANRVGIISNGRLIAEGSPSSLQREFGGSQRIEVDLVEIPADLLSQLTAQPFIKRVEQVANLLTIHTATDQDYRGELGKLLATQGAVIQGMRVLEASLEETFVTITETHIRQLAQEVQHGR
jgi:ABC-2 type transport system ATP-binding protein